MASTIISKRLTINGDAGAVVLDGLDFTGDGYIDVYGCTSLTIKNCRIYNLTATAAKMYWLHVYNDIELKIVVENCFFGNSLKNDVGQVYNMLEPTAKLSTGSSFSKNYWKKECCSHNFINIYGATDNAQIDVNENVFEFCETGIRIGVKGEPACKISLKNNKILSVNTEDPTWAGLALVQPYGKATTTFANMEVELEGNTTITERQFIAYYNDNDLILTKSNLPKVTIDGVVTVPEILH